jgi:hypothetical protein
MTGKSLSLGGMAIARRTSLQPAQHLSIESWRMLGEHICVINNSSAWWIGDWLIYGEEKYPHRYRDALKGTALDYQTLKNYAWVARKFAPPRRRAQLSFQHHVEVAALPECEQDRWLDVAEELHWSKDKLRKAIRAELTPPEAATAAEITSEHELCIRLYAEQDQHVAWQRAAKSANISIHEWILAALDIAAAAQLGRRDAAPPALV